MTKTTIAFVAILAFASILPLHSQPTVGFGYDVSVDYDGINPDIHGFNVYYYGTGTLNL